MSARIEERAPNRWTVGRRPRVRVDLLALRRSEREALVDSLRRLHDVCTALRPREVGSRLILLEEGSRTAARVRELDREIRRLESDERLAAAMASRTERNAALRGIEGLDS